MAGEVRIEVNLDLAKRDMTAEQAVVWVKQVLEQASKPGSAGQYYTVQAVREVK